MFLLATSNGARGAKTVLEIAHARSHSKTLMKYQHFLYLNTMRILIKLEELLIESYWINLKILLKFLVRTYNYEYINIYKGKSS